MSDSRHPLGLAQQIRNIFGVGVHKRPHADVPVFLLVHRCSPGFWWRFGPAGTVAEADRTLNTLSSKAVFVLKD